MKQVKIDDSNFPIRRVVDTKQAQEASVTAYGIGAYLILSCGHKVGLKTGVETPFTAKCYACSKRDVNV